MPARRSLDDYPEQTVDPTFEAEVHDWLKHGLSCLPVEQRLTLELAYHMGHSLEEIAAITDCPGRHGEGAHVSCAREAAPILAQLERRNHRPAGENRMSSNRRIENSAEHHEISALLPWYVNETLEERDRQRVDAHVGICAACREDLAAQRRICEAIAAEPALDYMPVASLKRLQARLDALQSGIGRAAWRSPQRAGNVSRVAMARMDGGLGCRDGSGSRVVGCRSLGAG